MKEGWKLFRKSYRNACCYYALFVDKNIRDNYGDDKELCEWVGEHTDGGSEYGYNVYCYPLRNKPTKIPKRFKPSSNDKLKILEYKLVSYYTICVVETIKTPLDKKIKKMIDKCFKEKKTKDETRKVLFTSGIYPTTQGLDYLDALYGS